MALAAWVALAARDEPVGRSAAGFFRKRRGCYDIERLDDAEAPARTGRVPKSSRAAMRKEGARLSEAKSVYADRSNRFVGDGSTGPMLERYLYEHGISRGELARRSGVSYPTISRMCSGDKIGTLSAWAKVADALGCTISDIIEPKGGAYGRDAR